MAELGWAFLTESHLYKPRDFPRKLVERIWERPHDQGKQRGFQSLSGEQAGTENLVSLLRGKDAMV